jgi:hypothetical protein
MYWTTVVDMVLSMPLDQKTLQKTTLLNPSVDMLIFQSKLFNQHPPE